MKKIIAVLSVASALFYVGCVPEYKIDKKGRPVAVQKHIKKTSSAAEKNTYYLEVDCMQMTLKYVMFDGHEYVVATNGRDLGITHSPRCECRK